MMHNFLDDCRAEIIARCTKKMSLRAAHAASPQQLEHGVPLFLDQLVKTLRLEQRATPLDGREVSGPAGGALTMSEVGISAAQHGSELLALGFSVNEVVHAYGDLCQAVTDLAYEHDIRFETDEVRTLNRCLDTAIAEAVTEFTYQQGNAVKAEYVLEANQHFGTFIHEMRNALQMATFAFDAAKSESLNLSGATGAILERSLTRLDLLIQESVAELRGTEEQPLPSKLFSAADFIREIAEAGKLVARTTRCKFTVSTVDEKLAISGNRNDLYVAVNNLVQNTFKFTHAHTEVIVDTYTAGDTILIDVKDHCGGLPAGSAERMFRPFTKSGSDKSGLGLGLSIARDAVVANGGVLSAVDVPGVGCVFTISLPRYAMPA